MARRRCREGLDSRLRRLDDVDMREVYDLAANGTPVLIVD
jgi:hypothetical protein